MQGEGGSSDAVAGLAAMALRKLLLDTPSIADELRTLRSTPSLRPEAVRRCLLLSASDFMPTDYRHSLASAMDAASA